MGVHDLWSIVEPVRESVPLYSLCGKTLAVDLSLWVCEAQHVQAMMGKVTKPYLRNLFFRVSSLTLMGVKLVFVMEGEAPKIKAETMSKRIETRYGGVKKASAPKCKSTTSRGRFKTTLRECADMLDYLGVPWVTAAGEAEAMCAYLDSQGLVDGCITNDGDAFLYGARTVYRNFNMNSKDPQVDCYKTSRVQTDLHLSRENLVGLAILLGCDYIPKGIPGVGKEQALKLIQMLKGQTLLQRFIQWKEQNASVSEGAVKKVAHCHLCRHPGSAKAHERGGCVLCDSKRFCQPQDFDYQCPCDWHCYEQKRQALSLDANIRKKTLASPQFPFTEIISEFLISKDKPVSHFKRRQPNMLSMQQFAYVKMEWPKHYTSEKVLVLMTYAELMNRKYRREISPQIKPLRILKPRVRNAVACFEIIWSTPEHYVFPEDRPADRHEVRTVEEESLVRVAFPEVVESYLREKALAEENKTKKKKSKSKKEKPCEVSDGISNLLAQMTLESSSDTQPQTQFPTISNTEEPEVVLLDTPVNNKQQGKSREDQSSLDDCPNTPLSHAESEAAASPSVSSVIDALHLSEIDWDAPSFTSSPTPQFAANHSPEPKLSKTTGSEVKETEVNSAKEETSSNVKDSHSVSAPELCYTECSLRDRLLLKNTAKAIDKMKMPYDMISKQLNYEVTSLKHTSSPDSNAKPNEQVHGKDCNDSEGSKSAVTKKEPLTDKRQCATNHAETETHSSKQQLRPAPKAKSRTKNKCNGPQKPLQRYKFVKTAVSSSTAPLQRCHSDPVQSDKNMHQITKKSVCMSIGSSSDESDAENKQFGSKRKANITHINKIKGDFLSDSTLKPVCGAKTTKSSVKTAHNVQLSQLKSQSYSVDTEIPMSTKNHTVSPANVEGDVFLRTPASPVTGLDSDDSVICSESPLPLAERLRLKLLK